MFFHYEGSPPPLDYPRPTKINQNGTRHPISKIGICHLIIDELCNEPQLTCQGYLYTERRQNYANNPQFSKYLFYHHGHAGDVQCDGRSHFVRYRSFPASETLWARIKLSRWAIGHSLFRCRRRSKRRFPISKERTILVAGVETISSLGGFHLDLR
ncbi:hypothetical protein BBC0244_019140 [Bartonella apihabitans]|nr:hypothetical protein BBC0244_019140 [Bartonella apihabitans]